MADLFRSWRSAIVRECDCRSDGRKEGQREEPSAEESSSRHAGYSTRRLLFDEEDVRAVLGYRRSLRPSAGDLRRLIARRLFVGVVERRQRHWIVPSSERPPQKTVREPWIFRQT